jgi:hypothetical protein
MTTQELERELKTADDLLPQDILRDVTIEQLAAQLREIFAKDKALLERDARFRDNFTGVVNYIYIVLLNKPPAKRQKNLFSDTLINTLLTSQPA